MSDQQEMSDSKIRFTIDDIPVVAEAGWTVLDTARHYHIPIPTLCYHEAVQPSGACRLCVVEVGQVNDGKVVISCMYPPFDGARVHTQSERVRNVRRWVLEMLLAECPASEELLALAAAHDVHKTRFTAKNPAEQCLLCGLCVSVCREVVGVSAISFGSRGVHKHVATPYMIPNQSCIACGCCVTVCPTKAMQARLDSVRGDVAQRTGGGFAH